MDPQTRQQQKNFRALLDCMARPGTKVTLESLQDYPVDLYDLTIDLALTLMDAETSFAVLGEDEKGQEEIAIRTLARPVALADADMVFIPLGQEDQAIDRALHDLKKGSFINPHLSATCFIEVEDLDRGTGARLEGPGIKDALEISLPRTAAWFEARKACLQFPLGWDLIFIDGRQRMMCLPRTTRLEVE